MVLARTGMVRDVATTFTVKLARHTLILLLLGSLLVFEPQRNMPHRLHILFRRGLPATLQVASLVVGHPGEIDRAAVR